MILKNAKVFMENGSFQEKDVFMEGEFFSSSPSGASIDASGLYAIPGLVDIHLHGAVGHDFCEGTHQATTAIASYEAKNGVTALCPATMTLPEETLERICEMASTWKPGEDCASLVGINMEGPFLSKEKCGAQNPEFLKNPDKAMFHRLQKASGGLIRLLDIAPELEGAFEMMEDLKGQVQCSLAHTACGYDQAKRAMDLGATHITHLFNAMAPLHHRSPGVIGAGAEREDCYAELITDMIHSHPSAVRAAFKLFGNGDRIVLISDSMMATGLSDGDYSLGGQAVKVKGSKAALADGTIAGSATNLMDCMRKAVKDAGIPLETGVKCATSNPARSIGVYGRHGSITPGKYGDLVLLNEDLEIQKVFLRGKEI